MANRWRARLQAKSQGALPSTDTALSPALPNDSSDRRLTGWPRSSLSGRASSSASSRSSPPALARGKRRQGKLTNSDPANPQRVGRYADDYLIADAPAGSQVILRLRSRQFDSYLQVLDRQSGALLFSNDDTERGTNSRLAFTAQRNTEYVVRATSYGFGETGRYSLKMQRIRPSIRNFSFTYGYGLVDAAAAIARIQGSAAASPRRARPDSGNRDDWNLSAVGGPRAWSRGFRGQRQVVAVIDTGVDLNHPDLRGNLWQNRGEIPGNGIDDDRNGFVDDRQGWDFVRNRSRPQDSDGHGTHVAGIIAAQDNGVGTTGVAPRAKIMPIRVLGSQGTDSHTLAKGIRYAVDNGADVINLSLGGLPGSRPSAQLKRSLRFARRRGVSVVIAAGNEGDKFGATQPGEPAFWAATHRLGIAVGAIDEDYRTASFSNPTGNRKSNWFVVAPGVKISSTFPGRRTALLSGTSMATPHVAGAIALLKSANPRLRPAQIATALVRTASRVFGA